MKKTFPRHKEQAYPEDLFTHKEGKLPFGIYKEPVLPTSQTDDTRFA